MGDKLGFTFYPKDWWTSDTFLELDPLERYIYLECLFVMYQNGGYMKNLKTQMEARLRNQIDAGLWEKITQRFILTDLGFTSDTVTKRGKKAETSRENGKKGGRPTKNEKPKNPENNLQKTHLLEKKEKEKENIYIYIKAKYINDKVQKIHDLEDYFRGTDQLPALVEAGWIHFSAFMSGNTGGIFNDPEHLYNAFRKFCITYKPPDKVPEKRKYDAELWDFNNWTKEAFYEQYDWRFKSDPEFKAHFEELYRLRAEKLRNGAAMEGRAEHKKGD